MMHLKNPNKQTGTLLIEVPADIGRAYSGYKRGGWIEGSEKFRKEIMSAMVWLFGMPLFNLLGNKACEKFLKIPMDIDYSNGSKGRDAIKDSLEFLANSENSKGLDVSELGKYQGKFKVGNIEALTKKIKTSKQIISFGALILNCLLMGVVLPKINQKITANKLKKEQKEQKEQTQRSPKFESMQEFQAKTKKENKEGNNISFTGVNPSNFADWVTYGVNNDNRFRLISTDVPMIIGRCATARNKYEALEIAFIDSASIYFYNLCQGNIESMLKKISATPKVTSAIGEYISRLDAETLKKAMEALPTDGKKLQIKDLFNETIQKDIYNQATYGKYGKINRFVKDEDLRSIDEEVQRFLETIKSGEIYKNSKVDIEALKKLIKKTNLKSSAFYWIGTIVSIFGLGILVPKIGYFITKKISGKDGFIGIAESKEEK